MMHEIFGLQFFAGGGGGGAGGGAGSGAAGGAGAGAPAAAGTAAEAESLENVQYGKQPEQAQSDPIRPEKAAEPPDRKKAFEALIKGEYKDEFAERTQQIINDRFKQTKTLETRMQQLDPVLQMLADKYGVDDPSDVEAISKAIQDDDSYYEDEADEKGLSVAQLKEFKRMERENAEFKRMAEEHDRQQHADMIYQQWINQSEQVKQIYGDFDLREEIGNPETGERFMGLLRNGIDVKTAYEVIHKDDIIGGAMQYAVQRTEKRVADTIRARGMRPQENGAGGNATAMIHKSDVNSLTKRDRDEIARRVRRGERITF